MLLSSLVYLCRLLDLLLALLHPFLHLQLYWVSGVLLRLSLAFNRMGLGGVAKTQGTGRKLALLGKKHHYSATVRKLERSTSKRSEQ